MRKQRMNPRMQSRMNLQLEDICYEERSAVLNSLCTGDLFKCDLVKVFEIIKGFYEME